MDRDTFAHRIVDDLALVVPNFLKRLIFTDGVVFSKKHSHVYAPERMRIVQTRKHTRQIAYYSQLPKSKSFELYEAIALGDRTGPMWLRRNNKVRDCKPTTDDVIYFIGNYIAPMADRIRGKNGWGPEETLYIVWDHAGVHLSHAAREVLEELNIEILGLPARCPELNVIEILWFMCKTKLRAKTFKNNSYNAFLAAVEEACSEVPQTKIDNLIKSFYGRCRQMILHKGKPFRYRTDVHDYDYEDEE